MNKFKVHKTVFVAVVITLMLTACEQKQRDLPYYGDNNFTPVWVKSTELPEGFHKIDNFSFVDQDSQTISRQTIEGHLTVVNFFFCSCPGVCPKIMKNLEQVSNKYPKVRILSHTVTPERDSVPILKKYAEGKGISNPYWHLLTGNKQQIYGIARNSYFADKNTGTSKDEFMHSEDVLLIDRDGYIRGVYKGTSEEEIAFLLNDILTLETID